jgi:hypothetical protein
MRELNELADELDVTVSWHSGTTMERALEGCGGLFIPNREHIVLRRGMSAWKQVVVLAHELGHALEWRSFDGKARKTNSAIMACVNMEMGIGGEFPAPVSDVLFDYAMERERVAWDSCDELLQELEVPGAPAVVRKMSRDAREAYARILRREV